MNKQTFSPNTSPSAAADSNRQLKSILVFGAGKSATCLIDYIVREAGIHGWLVTVADNDLSLARAKAGNHAHVTAVAVNVDNDADRSRFVQAADIVISLLPPNLHFLVARDCVLYSKHLLTASYTDNNIRALQEDIARKGLFFLCEMGLDPGIDHMSAMQMIHRVTKQGGVVTSFISHCGGLVAPESDDNPWHYKISWNPRSVVLAGKAGAVYLQNGETKKMAYENLFDETRTTSIPGIGSLSWYPNRDSLDYLQLYGLKDVKTFIRTTLRYPAFCHGWKQVVQWQLTSETIFYNTDDMTLHAFFTKHCADHAPQPGSSNEDEPDLFNQQLDWLGSNDDVTVINKGRCTAMDVLQFAMEKKLALKPADKDMIIMLHEMEYLLGGKQYQLRSSLVVKGDDSRQTAMAKTVGLPLGIAAKLVLLGKIKEKGLYIPVIPGVYEPVLEELQRHGIFFTETITELT